MGILESIIGHEKVRQSLSEAWIKNRLPSQLLFVGPDGIGKRSFAWGLAEFMLCSQAPEKGQACGVCSSCIKIRLRAHESVLAIEPDKNLIKLDRAKEIQEYLSLASDGTPRIIIVDESHTLNSQASNSLLKIFEEPPPHTFFIFITSRWTQILPTIRSRSTRVAFAPLSSTLLSRWAEGIEERVVWARGSVSEILNQREASLGIEKNEIQSTLDRLLNDSSYVILGDWRDKLKDREKLIVFLKHTLLLLKEVLFERASGVPSKLRESSCFQNLSDDELWALWQNGLNVEAGVYGHRDPVLLMEEWWYSSLGGPEHGDRSIGIHAPGGRV